MKLIIGTDEYDLLSILVGGTVDTHLELMDVTKAAGAEITVKRLRNYLVEDLIKNTEAGGHIDTREKLLCFAGLIFMARRNAGTVVTFDEARATPLDTVAFNWADDTPREDDADPKGPADSAPGDDSAATPV
ncbi:MAG TPA: hypothetical protein VGC45_15770 [Gryllotalpicola sp.]